jgi:hypothetical protein
VIPQNLPDSTDGVTLAGRLLDDLGDHDLTWERSISMLLRNKNVVSDVLIVWDDE